jgi:hypothetical protein
LLLRSYRQLPWLIVFVAGSVTALPLRWWCGWGKVERLTGGSRTSCEERRLLAEQERLRFWLRSWLCPHVPLSAALTILSVAHVIQMLCY